MDLGFEVLDQEQVFLYLPEQIFVFDAGDIERCAHRGAARVVKGHRGSLILSKTAGARSPRHAFRLGARAKRRPTINQVSR
jgi:hypothetical protein